MVNNSGALVEWVEYTPYGEARNHHRYDVDGDGDFDSTDKSIVQALYNTATFPETTTDIDEFGYRAEADINRDGTISSGDSATMGTSYAAAVSAGLISAPGGIYDNIIGYDGYVFNQESMQYCVRFRTYDPPLGRWIERDPLGYADSLSLSQFMRSEPVSNHYPEGLCCDCAMDRPKTVKYYKGPIGNAGHCENHYKACLAQDPLVQAMYRIATGACFGKSPKIRCKTCNVDADSGERCAETRPWSSWSLDNVATIVLCSDSGCWKDRCTTLAHELIHARQMCEIGNGALDNWLNDKFQTVCSEIEAFEIEPFYCPCQKGVVGHKPGSLARKTAENKRRVSTCQMACLSSRSQWGGNTKACNAWCIANYDRCRGGQYYPPSSGSPPTSPIQ